LQTSESTKISTSGIDITSMLQGAIPDNDV